METWIKNEPKKAHIEKQTGSYNIWFAKDENGMILCSSTGKEGCESWLEAAGYEKEDE